MFGLFQPPEVKATLAALDHLRLKFHQDREAVEIAFGEARRMVVEQKADTIASIHDQNWQPRDLALLLVSKSAFRHASSGQHHIYRNAPTPVGHGLRSIFEQAGDGMVASGFIEKAENEADRRTIRQAMAEVG